MKCWLCYELFHIKCIPITNDNSTYVNRNSNVWWCLDCTSSTLPFVCIEEESEYLNTLSAENTNINILENLVFNPFDINDDPNLRPWCDIDPDLQFFNDMTYINSNIKCNYFTETGLNAKIQENMTELEYFSVLHLNIRSVPKNLSSFDYLLCELEMRFTVIGLSETWLDASNVDLYDLEGYNSEHKYRENRKGGGVSLFVKNEIMYK
jgi:hypothetical protein